MRLSILCWVQNISKKNDPKIRYQQKSGIGEMTIKQMIAQTYSPVEEK